MTSYLSLCCLCFLCVPCLAAVRLVGSESVSRCSGRDVSRLRGKSCDGQSFEVLADATRLAFSAVMVHSTYLPIAFHIMEAPLLSSGCRRVWTVCHRTRTRVRPLQEQRRHLATEIRSDFRAAAPIAFNRDDNQFARRKRELDKDHLLNQVRVVPESPSYFTTSPQFVDDFLQVTMLLQKYQHLPQNPEPQRIAWIAYDQYTTRINERVRVGRFQKLIEITQRLSSIHAPLMPEEVDTALNRFKRTVQAKVIKAKEILPDKYGRTRAIGRRKTSSAECFVIEGEGEILINGRTMTNYFGRLHDRESAIWALKATNRADKYNVWARVTGGGTTGQAEAIQLGIAKALMAQEPALQPMLKRCKLVEMSGESTWLILVQLACYYVTHELSRERSLAD